MKAAADNFHHDVAAARAAASRGQRGEAEQWLRAALGHAESEGAPDGELATVLYELAALRRDEDDLGETELLLLRALDVLDQASAPDAALLLHTLSALGSVLAARGESARAEEPLARALHLGERLLGAAQADLGGVVNDLSRLHLKAGAYAAAEPLLLRLYDVKCATKGEDHPESATVLASLATARQALGRHEDAESMWRRVLAVREHTLAPNHFATATSLEHLAESCAARGKLSEAVQLLRRAVTMRELTLGASHPSVRVARDRIADLRLQASDGAPENFAPTERSLPLPMPVLSSAAAQTEPRNTSRTEPVVTPRAEPAPRAAPIVTPRAESIVTPRAESIVTPRAESIPVPRVESFAAPRAEPIVTARVERSEPMPFVRAGATEGTPASPASVVMPASSGALALHEPSAARATAGVSQSVYEGLMSIRAELASSGGVDEDDADEADGERRTAFGVAALAQLRNRRVPIIAASAVTVVLLAGVVAMRSRAQGDLYASQSSAAQRVPAAVAVLPNSASERHATSSAALSTEPTHAVSGASTPESHAPVSTQRRVVNGDVAPTVRSTPTPTPTVVSAPAAPPKLISNLGAIAGAVQASIASVSESSRAPLAADAPKRKFDLSVADGSSEFVRARLIGTPPVPKFPEILRDRKIVGDVLVRFTVDAQGRPDLASVTVIRTPHELMSDAVRRVISTLRFEPAHSGRIGAPAEPDQVQMAFQFNGATN